MSVLVRWGGIATMLGGVMWVAKGSLIMLGIMDLGELLIVAQLFFAAGLIALHSRLGGRGGLPGRIGGLLAYAAAALSVVNVPHSVFAEDGPQNPFPFNVTYAMAALALFLGLVFLGVAALRAGTLPRRWRALPLAIGVSALLPVWVLAFVHLEIPIVVLGLAWSLLGYVIWAEAGMPARRPSRAS